MHWDTVIIAVITGLPACLAAIAAFYATILNGRKIDDNTNVTTDAKLELKRTVAAAASQLKTDSVKAAEKVAEKAAEGVNELKQAVNGRLTEQVDAAYDRGLLQGQAASSRLAAQVNTNTEAIVVINGKLDEILKRLP